MTPPDPWGALARDDLDGVPSTPLSNPAGHEGEPRVTLLECPAGKAVLKEWKPREGLILRLWSRWLIGREVSHYRLLAGCAGIPRLLRVFDERSFLLEHVDGQRLGRKLPASLLHRALDDFERLLGDLHSRRFAHLDVRNKGNILVDAEGRAWAIDIAQGVDCSRGILRRLIFPFLRRIDRSAIAKHRARYAPETLDPAVRERVLRRYARRGPSWSPAIMRILRRIFFRGDTAPLRIRPRHRAPAERSEGRGGGEDAESRAGADGREVTEGRK